MVNALPRVLVLEFLRASSMAQTSLSSNASSAARLLSGSVGEILISASRVTSANAQETMFRRRKGTSFPSVQARLAAL